MFPNAEIRRFQGSATLGKGRQLVHGGTCGETTGSVALWRPNGDGLIFHVRQRLAGTPLPMVAMVVYPVRVARFAGWDAKLSQYEEKVLHLHPE